MDERIDPAEDDSLVDACPDMLSVHRGDGSFLKVSAVCQSLLGWSTEELRGQRLVSLVHPEDRGLFNERWPAALRNSEAPTRVVCRLRRADGLYASVELRLRLAPSLGTAGISGAGDGDSAVDGAGDSADERRVYGAARLMEAPAPSEFAYTEPETLEQAARHRDFLVGMMPGMVWYCRIDPDQKLHPPAYMSRYLERFAGYTPEEWVHTPGFWASLLFPEDREAILEATRRALRGEGSVPPYRLRARDGRVLWIQSVLGIERTPEGMPLCMYGLALDVTRYKEAEALVAASRERERVLHERLEGLVASVPGVVWERWEDRSGALSGVAFCSEYVERLTGYSADEWRALADGWLTLTPEADRTVAAEAWQEAWARDSGVIRHRVVTRDARDARDAREAPGARDAREAPDGRQVRWVEHHVRVVVDAGGAARCMRGITLDITERVQMEEERERLRVEIERQSMRIVELSVPLIPVSDKVVVLPLIGTLGEARGELLLTTLLRGLEATRADVAVIDLTGVPALDQSSADLIGRAACAARLLGTRVVITGVRPEVARALVQLGVDLPNVELRRSLQGALGELLRR